MVVLGLDIGTTSTKGIAFNEQGEALAAAQREYDLLRPKPGYYELDSRRMLGSIREVIRDVAGQVGKGRIGGIASSALGEAVLPVDRKGNPLSNTIAALDHRAVEQAQTLAESIDPAEFFRLTGQSLHPIASIFKILWWRDREPRVFEQASKFLCWNDMLALTLGIEPAISASLAARTGLYDLQQGGWSRRLLEIARLREDQLARIVAPGEVVDTVARIPAEDLGLAGDCVYVSGGWDQVCAALGSGAVAEGIVVNSMGSTDSLNASYGATNTSEAMLECHFTCTPAAVPGLYCTNAFSLSGGNLMAWFRDHLDRERAESLAAEGGGYFPQMVAEALESRNPALVLAHFTGSGTPSMDPESRGALLGLSLATEKRDIALGILEGIALEMALNLEALKRAGIPLRVIHVGSGGARSPELVQMRADVFNLPVTPLDVEEAGCLACGMLALGALDPSRSVQELVRCWVKTGEPVIPRPQQAEHYARKREIYKRLYPALRDLNSAASEFQGS